MATDKKILKSKLGNWKSVKQPILIDLSKTFNSYLCKYINKKFDGVNQLA